MCIGHKSTITNKKIGKKEEKKIMTPKKRKSLSNLFRFLIITLPISYDSNVLYFLWTHDSKFVSMFGKKKKKFWFQSIEQNIEGEIFYDKYSKKKRKTKGMSLYL